MSDQPQEEQKPLQSTPEEVPEATEVAPEAAGQDTKEASEAPKEASEAPKEASEAPKEASEAPEEASEASEEASGVPEDPEAAGQEAAEIYFEQLRESLLDAPDGAWLGSDSHEQAFQTLLAHGQTLLPVILQVLQQEPSLALRYDALRLAYQLQAKEALLPVLKVFLGRASFSPLYRRRLRRLSQLWKEDNQFPEGPLPPLVEAHQARIQQALWLGPPAPPMALLTEELTFLGEQGEPGLYGVTQLLRQQIEEGRLMEHGCLALFQLASDLFVTHNYFEGVQVFFDFLADCKPCKPGPAARKTVGSVLKAVRKLRPYRYPQWAKPLQKFIEHYRTIGRKGRAAEANMLLILIQSTALEDALLLEDDELVDLLRGRRDAAYTQEEQAAVAQLCDELLDAGRTDPRIFHIRGWLAATLEGAEAAEPFFQQAINQQEDYVYSHVALSYIYEQWGEEDLLAYHLTTACEADQTLISCQRKLGEVLERADLIDKAVEAYKRGTAIQPDQVSVFELEELYGCYASLARVYDEFDELDLALHTLDQLTPTLVFERFGARFCLHQKVIVDLLHKGLRDFRAELARSGASAIADAPQA